MTVNVYTVHVHERTASASAAPSAFNEPDVVLVPEGFSLWAFLFGPLWALTHRLWMAAIILFLGPLAIIQMLVWLSGPGPVVTGALALAAAMLSGLEAFDLWRWTLDRHGYKFDETVIGECLEDAERRYFEDHHLTLAARLTASADQAART